MTQTNTVSLVGASGMVQQDTVQTSRPAPVHEPIQESVKESTVQLTGVAATATTSR